MNGSLRVASPIRIGLIRHVPTGFGVAKLRLRAMPDAEIAVEIRPERRHLRHAIETVSARPAPDQQSRDAFQRNQREEKAGNRHD